MSYRNKSWKSLHCLAPDRLYSPLSYRSLKHHFPITLYCMWFSNSPCVFRVFLPFLVLLPHIHEGSDILFYEVKALSPQVKFNLITQNGIWFPPLWKPIAPCTDVPTSSKARAAPHHKPVFIYRYPYWDMSSLTAGTPSFSFLFPQQLGQVLTQCFNSEGRRLLFMNW